MSVTQEGDFNAARAVAWFLLLRDMLHVMAKKRKEITDVHAQEKNTNKQNQLTEEQIKEFKETWSASSLTVEKLAMAETAVIQFCQKEEFPEELVAFQRGNSVKADS